MLTTSPEAAWPKLDGSGLTIHRHETCAHGPLCIQFEAPCTCAVSYFSYHAVYGKGRGTMSRWRRTLRWAERQAMGLVKWCESTHHMKGAL